MNFDVFNGIKFPEKYGGAKRLLDYCKESERNILINPWLSLDAAGNALMTLCKGILKIHGVKQTLREDGQANLVTMIQTCVDNGLFNNGDAAHTIRKNRNNAEYYKKKQDYLPINSKTVSLATESTLALFNIMKEAFDGFETVCFDELKIPFGNYEIDRVVEKSKSEILYGQYNYFVHNDGGDYLFWQVFPRGNDSLISQALNERNQLVKSRIKGDKRRKSYILETITPYVCPDESDRDYIGYVVYSDSLLLSERTKPFDYKQAIQIGLDLINTVKEMGKVSAGIHHRNIQPGCVIITPNEGTFMAGLVNMETAKVTDYEYTVFASIKGILQRNIYLPRELRNYKEGDQVIDWGKVDLYSIAKVIIYCLDPELVAEEIDTDALYDMPDLSDNLIEAFRVIFESSINEIYSVDEFEEILKNELTES